MKKILLDLGCGNLKYQSDKYEVIGLDSCEGEGVDVVFDLTSKKLPFDDKYFDVVRASHILEHIEHNKHFFNLIKEVHRILKDDGEFWVSVPHHKSRVSVVIPEHTRFFNSYSFDYFREEKRDGIKNFSEVNFKVFDMKFNLIRYGGFKVLNVFNPIYNVNRAFTEKILSNLLLPPEEVKFKMRKN